MIETPDRPRSRGFRLEGAPGFLLLCLAWLLLRPYQGVHHDAILYLGQALHLLRPEIFDHDLFFLHGSQDRFTIATPPLAWLLSRFDVAPVEMALTAAFNLAFLAATWVLAGVLAPGRRWLATAGVVLLSHAYGVVADFNYAENFFTARSVAEPLVLLGLAAWIRDRRLVGGALLVVAALVHPLMTLPALVSIWTWQVMQDRRWLWGLAVLLPVAALAAADVGPFGNLLRRFDDPWWIAVGQFGSQVRMLSWHAIDVVSLALDAILLALGATVLSPAGRRFALALLAACALLLAAGLVGGDLARDVLLVQLQLWRVLWLVHAVAMLGLPLLVIDRWRVGGAARLVGVAAATAVLAVSWTLPYAAAFVGWLLLAVLVAWRPGAVWPALTRAAVVGSLLAMAAATILLLVNVWRAVAHDAVLASVTHPAFVALAIPTVGALALAAAAWLMLRLPAWGGFALVLALFVSFIPRWDQRSQWIRVLESTPFGQHPFAAAIPPTAQVYWHMELLLTWSMLGRASWVSPNQGSGIVFNRDTALEFVRRSAPMYAMFAEQARCQMAVNAAGGKAECQPSQASIEALCKMPGAPDFTVFDAPYPHGMVARWDYRVARDGPVRTSYLYDCAKMR